MGMTCHDKVTFVSLIFGVEEMVEMEEMVHGRLKHFRAKAKGWFEWVEFEPFGVDMCFFCGLSWLCVVGPVPKTHGFFEPKDMRIANRG